MMSGSQIRDNPETLFSFELIVEKMKIYKAGKVSNELAVGVRLLDFPTLLIHQPEERRGRGEGHQEEEEVTGDHVFNRGKCCFFKMDLDSLHTHLSNTPVYTMLLDVKEEIPRLIGTSLIRLSAVMESLKQDVTEHGASSTSCHGERGIVGVCSLTGEKMGEMCVRYKLKSLGGNVTEKRGETSMSVQENNVKLQSEADSCRNKTSQCEKMLQNDEKLKVSEENASKQTQEEDFEDDSAIFCPPRLFFCNSAEERSRNKTSQTLTSADFQYEEEEGDEPEGVSPPASPQKAKQVVETPEDTRTNDVTPNILGDAVQQLPLLNALLVELSQLSGRTSQQPLSVHPNLAWIYRPASADLKSPKSPRKGPTPSFKHGEEGKSCSTTPGKKLVFGTTKTFNLRMERVSPVRGRQRECEKSKTQKQRSLKKGSRRKPESKWASGLSEDVRTAVESVREDSPRNPEKVSLSESIHIPTVRGDTSDRNEDESERHSGSHHSGPDRRAEDAESSRGRSSRSSVSDSAGEGSEEYPDDFNSLEPSDAYSPDPMSSPESSRAKTPKPPARLPSDSSSEGVHRRVGLPVPVPIPAPRSPPQRSLRGTHIIRPRTDTSALSVSSDDADRDTSASVQTVLSRKQMAERGGADSSVSSGGQRSEASRHSSSRSAPGFSAGSSVELQEAEDDELGTLDFRKDYKHISELVANKLPGYTM